MDKLEKQRPLNVRQVFVIALFLLGLTTAVGYGENSEIVKQIREMFFGKDSQDVLLAFNNMQNRIVLEQVDPNRGVAIENPVTSDFFPFDASPDGNFIIYTTPNGIETFDIRTGETHTALRGNTDTFTYSSPTFMSDRQIAFVMSDANNRSGANVHSELSILDTETGATRVLNLSALMVHSELYLVEAHYEGGRWLLRMGRQSGSGGVFLVTDGNGNELMSYDMQGGLFRLAFAPDGNSIAYTMMGYNTTAIIVHNVDSGDRIEFTNIRESVPWIDMSTIQEIFIDNDLLFIAVMPTQNTNLYFPDVHPLYFTLNTITGALTPVNFGELDMSGNSFPALLPTN